MVVDGDVVLVVDDDLTVRRFLKHILEDVGYRVVTASDGREALQKVAESAPSVILLDVRMPVMDGSEFVRAFRVGRRRPAPIIVMTGAADAEAWAMALKADACLAKPFEPNDLLQVVTRFRREERVPALRTAPELEYAHF
jgi:chemosensory pili system protein ChpA (sensor histidine kinase/response regulator)